MPQNLIFGGITIVATKRASPVLLCELLDTADATILNSVCEHLNGCVRLPLPPSEFQTLTCSEQA